MPSLPSGRGGPDWRIPLLEECWFYIRTCRNWRQVVRARLYGEALNEFVLRSGNRIGFDGEPPWQIFQEIWRYHAYTPSETRHLQPRTILDIGANIGFFSLYAIERWRGARLVAIEPEPGNFKRLEQNLCSTRAQNVRCVQCAAAGQSGTEQLFLRQEAGWHSLYGEDTSNALTVNTLSLDDIFERYALTRIDFLKIDCEGAEYAILGAAEPMLCEKVGFVAMEYHEIEGHRVNELERILECAGMKVRTIPQPRWGTGMLYAQNPFEG